MTPDEQVQAIGDALRQRRIADPGAWFTDEEACFITRAAQTGSEFAMAVIEATLRTRPDQSSSFMLRGAESIASSTEEYLLKEGLGPNLLLRHIWRERLAELRQKLSKSDQSPLETMLIDRIVTCYLAVHLAELEAEANKPTSKAAYYDKRLNQAHHRYVSATIALARVRHLLAPVLQQVNIAGAGAQQLNVMTPANVTASPMPHAIAQPSE
jgi:hypothetical protein